MSVKQSYIQGRKGPGYQKPSKRGHISWMLDQTRTDLKIYNLTTANATLMIHQNYVPPTPQHEMFNLAEDLGV